MSSKTRKLKLLICGGTGFIGRNLCDFFSNLDEFEVHATRFRRPDPKIAGVEFYQIDLRNPDEVAKLVPQFDIVLQAAATTSGAKDIVSTPALHVTDNAVMNSYVFREAQGAGIQHVVFFSCSVMYPSSPQPVTEDDFRSDGIFERYFGIAWTKVYLEKMAEFYAHLGPTKFSVVRHSNVYGPYDKFDLEKSHVFGATVAKVMQADNQMTVWGPGTEVRDFLYVGDLCEFVQKCIAMQTQAFTLVNVGSGKAVSVNELVGKIQRAAGKELRIFHDETKPSLPVRIILNCQKALESFNWQPKTNLDVGIEKTIEWYQQNIPNN